MKQIRTSHWLDAPPERVWAVLADFDRYAEWNPLNVGAQGKAEVGSRVPMRFVDAGGGKGKVISQSVLVTVSDPPRRLEWVGRIPLLFTGRHFFELVAESGGTRLLHGEDLSGLMPRLFSDARIEQQKAAYEALNRALEERVAELSA